MFPHVSWPKQPQNSPVSRCGTRQRELRCREALFWSHYSLEEQIRTHTDGRHPICKQRTRGTQKKPTLPVADFELPASNQTAEKSMSVVFFHQYVFLLWQPQNFAFHFLFILGTQQWGLNTTTFFFSGKKWCFLLDTMSFSANRLLVAKKLWSRENTRIRILKFYSKLCLSLTIGNTTMSLRDIITSQEIDMTKEDTRICLRLSLRDGG